MTSANQPAVSVGRTVLEFFLILLVMSFVVGILFKNVGLEGGAVIRLLVALLAALLASMRFNTREGRPPEGNEVWRLVLWSFFAMFLFASLVGAIVWIVSGTSLKDVLASIQDIPIGLATIFTVILLAAYGVALWLGYGPLGRYIINRRGR